MSDQSGEIVFDDQGNIIEEPAGTPENVEEGSTPDSTGSQLDDPTPLGSDDGDDGDDGDDDIQASESGVDDEDREAIRERRRQERHQRKERQRERENTLRNELAVRDAALAEMQQQLDAINRRNTGSEMAQLQKAKNDASQAYGHFKEQVKLATASGDGETLVDAIEKMNVAQRRFDDLDRIEKAYVKQQRNPAPPPLDPRLKQHAESWMSQHPWYNPSGADEDSEIMLTIDQRMAREGWNPQTPEYWAELTRRAKKHLPHRYNGSPRNPPGQNMTNRPPKTIVGSSGKESPTPATRSGFKVSAERVQALKDAGMWNDPAKRADAIRRFKEYDKQNKG